MSLLNEIQVDLVNESAGLSNTLRKAKILSSTLGLPEFREWVDQELSGYGDNVPGYRTFRPRSYGTFSGPFQSGAKNVILPTSGLPEFVRKFAEEFEFRNGVGALEAMTLQDSDSYERRWPQELVAIARETIGMTGDRVLVDVSQPIPTYIVSGVLDNIRNRLLDFILGLHENDIDLDSLNRSTQDMEAIRKTFNITIYGDHNIVASGQNINQEVHTVLRGDIDSLLAYFRSINIDSGDLATIKEATSVEQTPPQGKFGSKVSEWIGRMIGKAASGTWDVSLNTASRVLGDALSSYYGL